MYLNESICRRMDMKLYNIVGRNNGDYNFILKLFLQKTMVKQYCMICWYLITYLCNMHHVAIMKKSLGMIPKILSGEKTIESRWYQTKRAPWGRVLAGDTVFFKDAGCPVVIKARVSRVLCQELYTVNDVQQFIDIYGKDICLHDTDVSSRERIPRYVILVWISDVARIEPCVIDKTGYGMGNAWLICHDIHDLMKQ